MSRRRWLSLLVSGTVWLIGCDRKAPRPAPKPAAISADAVVFPAMWVFGDTSVMPLENAGQLNTLHVNYVNREETRRLVDSALKVYRVSNLRSTKSGAWQMANPSGTTPIAFDLEIEAEGIDAVRKAVAECKYLASDSDAARERIRNATTLQEMIDAIQADAAQKPG
jgi:hypothetical protein